MWTAIFMSGRQATSDGGSNHSEALALFRREGDSKASRATLERAVEVNVHVPAYLLGRKRLPSVLPALIAMGSEDEAVAYVHDAAAAWAAAPAALAWFGATLARVPAVDRA